MARKNSPIRILLTTTFRLLHSSTACHLRPWYTRMNMITSGTIIDHFGLNDVIGADHNIGILRDHILDPEAIQNSHHHLKRALRRNLTDLQNFGNDSDLIEFGGMPGDMPGLIVIQIFIAASRKKPNGVNATH